MLAGKGGRRAREQWDGRDAQSVQKYSEFPTTGRGVRWSRRNMSGDREGPDDEEYCLQN